MRQLAKIALILFTIPVGATEASDYKGHIQDVPEFKKITDGDMTYIGYDDRVEQMLTEAEAYDIKRIKDCNCQVKSPTSGFLPFLNFNPADTQCEQEYKDFFQGPEVKLNILFGFKDIDENYSTDAVLGKQLKDHLANKDHCPEGSFTCGYSEARDGSLYKPIDIYGERKIIRMNVKWTSTHSDRSRINKNDKTKQEQTDQSAKMDAFYRKNVCGSALTLLDMHGRYGRAFSWDMPDYDGEKVDYLNEGKKHPMDDLKKSLDNCGGNLPKIFSMFACHYKNVDCMLDGRRGMAVQTPVQFAHDLDFPFQALGTINGLLSRVCQPQLDELINPKFVDPMGKLSLDWHPAKPDWCKR